MSDIESLGSYVKTQWREYREKLLRDFWLIKTDAFGYVELELGLTITNADADTLTLYRGTKDPYWNYLRVVIWVVKDTP